MSKKLSLKFGRFVVSLLRNYQEVGCQKPVVLVLLPNTGAGLDNIHAIARTKIRKI
jgi:hypothetical protein